MASETARESVEAAEEYVEVAPLVKEESRSESPDLNHMIQEEIEVKSHQCEECGKSFTTSFKLYQHKLIHRENNQKPFSCDVCEKRFSFLSQLTKHKKSLGSRRLFSCAACGKGFHFLSHLRRHEKTHVRVQCDQCPRSFILVDHLTLHKRIHSKKKSYVCDECGQMFRTSYDLTRHEMIHKNIRPFKCEFCEKTFRAASDVKRHQTTHITSHAPGTKPYKCDQCPHSFQFPSELVDHKQMHTSLQCCICKKCFPVLKDLRDHIRRIHNLISSCKCAHSFRDLNEVGEPKCNRCGEKIFHQTLSEGSKSDKVEIDSGSARCNSVLDRKVVQGESDNLDDDHSEKTSVDADEKLLFEFVSTTSENVGFSADVDGLPPGLVVNIKQENIE